MSNLILNKYLVISREHVSPAYSDMYLEQHILDICSRLIYYDIYDPTHIIISCMHHAPNFIAITRHSTIIKEDTTDFSPSGISKFTPVISVSRIFVENDKRQWFTEFAKGRIDAITRYGRVAANVLALDLLSHYNINRKLGIMTKAGEITAISALSYIAKSTMVDEGIVDLLKTYISLYYSANKYTNINES